MSEHVTVLYPFLHIDLVDDTVLTALSELFVRHREFDLEFEACGRFPDVLYIIPVPEAPLRALTRAVAQRWPETPPYGGKYPDSVPHLTIAYGQSPEVFDRIEVDVASRLPIRAHVTEVLLVVSDGVQWHQGANFPLARTECQGSAVASSP